MKTIIIDDEKNATIILESIIRKHCPELNIVSIEYNADSGITAIEKHNPDLIFLDVELQKGTGFDILERTINYDFDVIFTTAYDHYAIKAIKYSAIDYLLKPIDVNELIAAVKKLKEEKQNNSLLAIKNLLSNLKETKKKLSISNTEGTSFIEVCDIVRCEADVNYTHFFLKDGQKLTASRTLKEFASILSEQNFIRTHQSHLVNPSHVKKFLKLEDGLLMSDGKVVEVSTRRKTEVLSLLSKLV